MVAKKRKKSLKRGVAAKSKGSHGPKDTELADIGIRSSRAKISKDKQSEEMLRAPEKSFRDLVEITTDWIWEVDKNALYTYASPQIEKFLGYKPQEVIGKTPFDLMPAEEAKRISEFFKRISLW